jgi:hypothetical protein
MQPTGPAIDREDGDHSRRVVAGAGGGKSQRDIEAVGVPCKKTPIAKPEVMMTNLHIVQPPTPVEPSTEVLSELIEDVRVTFGNVHGDLLDVSAALGRISKSIDVLAQIVGSAIDELDSHLYS